MTLYRLIGLECCMFVSMFPNLPTKERLAATAAELMMRQSFGAVSVDDICKAAGVQKGTFYHHFPSKVELALAAYEFMWIMAQEFLEECFSNDLPPLDKLRNYTRQVYEFHKESFEKEGKVYGCPIACAGHEMGAQDEKIRIKIKEIFDMHGVYLERFLREIPSCKKLSPEEIRSLSCEMQSYKLGVLYQAKVANDPEIIKRDLYAGLVRLTGEKEIETAA